MVVMGLGFFGAGGDGGDGSWVLVVVGLGGSKNSYIR